MGRGTIPDRWLNYKPIGKTIDGTRFIAFKVPLKQHISETVDDRENRLDDKILLQAIPNLGLIIDLTNTSKYYNPLESFEKNGIKHIKIMVPGHIVPDLRYRNKFKEAVNDFLEINKNNDKLIGVHCTHGVNRTGFLICNYMVREMNIEPNEAMQRFAIARGHPIERENYKSFINANMVDKSSNDNITTKNYNNSKRPRIEVPLTKNDYQCDNESWEQNSINNSYSRPVVNNSWRERESARNNSWTERELLPPRNNSWRERELQPPRNITWRERELQPPRNNSWRERESLPPREEPPSVIRAYSSHKRNYQEMDQKPNYSWRSQPTSINSSSVSRVANSYQETTQKNINYMPHQSNNQPNNTERITYDTASRDNYYNNSNGVYGAQSLNHNSKLYDKVTDRYERNPRGSNYRTQHTPKYDSKKDTKSAICRNYDNKTNLQHRRKDPSQRTSMLDNLY